MRRLRRTEFLHLVEEALRKLPPRIRAAMDNVAIVVEDWPTRQQLAEAGMEGRYDLLGLYQGIPLPEREGSMVLLPDKITLFQRPIEELCETVEEVVEEVRVTLLHEIGHYLGLSEADLERLGYH